MENLNPNTAYSAMIFLLSQPRSIECNIDPDIYRSRVWDKINAVTLRMQKLNIHPKHCSPEVGKQKLKELSYRNG